MNFMALWHVYVLKLKDGSLYTGIARDVERRLEAHNAGKGSKAVRSRRPAKVVYTQAFRTMSAALKREAEIKGWKRADKLALVARRKK